MIFAEKLLLHRHPEIVAAMPTPPHEITIHTARLFTVSGAGVIDVTRKSGDALGKVFAPSWGLLMPFKNRAWARDKRLKQALKHPDERVHFATMSELELEAQADWLDYEPKYIDEMKLAYGNKRAAWRTILTQCGSEITLCCYCVEHCFCHRTVLARLLLAAGPKNGARVTLGGERRTA